MTTPESDFETAVDESNDKQTREDAIDELRTANECDRLADLARMDDLADEFREQAVEKLAHPQCKPMLETLVENEELPDTLHEQAATLLEETPEDSGAGP